MIRRLVFAVLATALPVLAVVGTAVAPTSPAAAAPNSPTPAYWLAASDGGIFSFGGAPFYGSTGGMVLNKPVVGMAATSDGGGYYEVASDGGVFSYGDATFYGSTGSIHLNQPVVGMAVVPGGGGYWLVASDGGIFSYGDATFYGSTGSIRLNKPVVGMAATPSGHGYWLVASDGGIFSYGDASFYGSTGSIALNKPIIGMITGQGGGGYFLVASDGGIFSFGSAPFYGSLGGLTLKHPIVAAAATPTDSGYWFTDTAGLVSNFGAANYYGSAPANLFRPIVAMAEATGSTGAFIGGTYPSGSYGYDISKFQCGSLPGGDHQIGIVQVDGSSSANVNTCLSTELAWAGGGLNLYTYLTYFTSATNEPGCNGDVSCNAGYQAGIHAYGDAFNAGAGSTATPWWLDVESNSPSIGAWSTNLPENAQFVQGALNALHETEGIADVGIYASPGVWNSIVGNYAPSVPYWMADYLASPSGPGSCADYSNQVAKGHILPGPPQIVQYFSGPVPGSSGNYDDDYAC
ncbi:MAG TPA: hypothetical protein VH012_04445 [Acidimicrobiales bacterium]|nr:hypothetical protein [Acidimicrobiales bacterium]